MEAVTPACVRQPWRADALLKQTPDPARSRGSRRVAGFRRLWVLVTLALLCAGCHASPPPAEPEAEPPLGTQREGYFGVDVLFASDRAWDRQESAFNADRGERLLYGACEISIPPNHEPGQLEEPGFFRSETPTRHVLMSNLTRSPEDAFFRRLQSKVRGSRRKEVFVFVHGAITTFDFAARRAGQIAFDVGLDGAVVLYSWPTEGRVSGYMVDGTNAEWTRPHLARFLQQLSERSGADHIHILAHSMGNDLVTRAVRDLVRRRPRSSTPVFDQVVLAAADMDLEVFARDIAPDFSRGARRITVYVSARDRALSGSRKLHKYPRLGDGRQSEAIPRSLQNLDVVDVSAIAEDWTGHEYYGGNPCVLRELRGVLRGDSPKQRGLNRDGAIYRLQPHAEQGG